jgi:hypothetical protein
MNDELLALYTADREERIDQPQIGTLEYTAMRKEGQQRYLRTCEPWQPATMVINNESLEKPGIVALKHVQKVKTR